MYFVYVLLSEKDGKFYTGFTNNPLDRVRRHNRGFEASTKYRRPLKLIYLEGCLSRKDAMRREIYLKTSWGKRYIKNRLKDYLQTI